MRNKDYTQDPVIDLFLERSDDVTLAISEVEVVGKSRNGRKEKYRAEVRVAAKKNKEDKPNPYVGNLLATGRALELLGKKLQKAAWGEISHADYVRKLKAEAKEEKKVTTEKKRDK